MPGRSLVVAAGVPPGGKTPKHSDEWRVAGDEIESGGHPTSGRRSGRQDAALYGRRDACRHTAGCEPAPRDFRRRF